MTTRSSRSGRNRDTIALAGWLFADLLLGLAMLFFVFNTIGVRPTPTPYPTFTPGPTFTPYPTYTPGPTPTPYPTFTPGPTFTPYPTYTPGPSPTPYPTYTPEPTYTPGPTFTPYPTYTPGPSPTPGPTYTPYPTYTPGPSPTPYPTYTPEPTFTPYPTYTPGPTPTPGPTFTPYPTYTPGPSPTPYPTYTPGPTATPYPTYTPRPTLRPLPTYTPLPRTGLDAKSYAITVQGDADALLGKRGAAAKTEALADLRTQILEQIRPYLTRRAGIVLTFGMSPDPYEGNEIAREVNLLLRAEFPALFGDAILRDYHDIDRNPANRGKVEIEIYLLMEQPL